MYYNNETIIYYKGDFIKAVDAKANPYDQSLHYGYAVFEGIRAYDTINGVKIFKAKEHYDRLKFSADAINMPYSFDSDELTEITYEVLRRNNLNNAYIRPLVSCTPNMSLTKGKESELLIAAWDWAAYMGDTLLRLKTSPFCRLSPASFMVTAKVSGHYINSIMATQDAKDTGFDEALLLDMDGYVAEGSGANIFIESGGKLYTPQTGNILPGITRATVLEICNELDIEVLEKQITIEEVYGKDGAFFCGTGAEIVGIESLDNIAFTKNWNESIGAIIQKAYKNLVVEKEYRLEEVE